MVETSKNKHEEADGKASRIQQLARFWNWLQFPLVLLLLVGGGFWFNVQQDQRNLNLRQQQQATSLRIAADQQHETLLANYIDSISDLLVHNNLIHAGANDPWKSHELRNELHYGVGGEAMAVEGERCENLSRTFPMCRNV
jgi:hypothetical protein